MSVDSQQFRDTLAQFPAGVTVVTVGPPQDYHGITVSAFCSLSLKPPLILVCIDRDAAGYERIAADGSFTVNILREDQGPISDHFAARGAADDAVAALEPAVASTGAAVLTDTLASLDCRLQEIHDAGDHGIFIGAVEWAEAREGRPLVYHDRAYFGLRGLVSRRDLD